MIKIARISKTVCDRCGTEMVYIGWTARIRNAVRRGKNVKIREYFDGNPDGYSYSDSEYELCRKCTKELESFLSVRKCRKE